MWDLNTMKVPHYLQALENSTYYMEYHCKQECFTVVIHIFYSFPKNSFTNNVYIHKKDYISRAKLIIWNFRPIFFKSKLVCKNQISTKLERINLV